MATTSQYPIPAHQLRDNTIQRTTNGDVDIITDSDYVPSGNAKVVLNYFNPPVDGSKPHNYVDIPNDGTPQRNFGERNVMVEMHDIRGRESEYTLDEDGFIFCTNQPESLEKDFVDDDSIKKNYYPEVEKLILNCIPGSNKVVFFDHTIRRAKPDAHRMPVTRVHVDQTARSAKERVIRHCPEEAEKLLKGRYRIINVWRPLNGPVQGLPLAMASSATVDSADLVPIEHRYPDRTGETAGVQYNPKHKWHYLSGMRDDERLFLECFDSEALREGSGVQGGRVPHTAFVDPRTPQGARERESIEVRALVFGP